MYRIDEGTENERVVAKVKIIGEYKGFAFEAETENYYWVKRNNEPSRAWWEDGNMACDCNRSEFLPEGLIQHYNGECGHEIKIFKIIPIEEKWLPIIDLTVELLELDEIESN